MPFQFFEIEVYIDGALVPQTDYLISQSMTGATGSVVFLAPPASGTSITIVSATRAEQTTDYVEDDPFPADTHERALDRLAMAIQDTIAKINRSLQVTPGTTVPIVTLDATNDDGRVVWVKDGALSAFHEGPGLLTVGSDGELQVAASWDGSLTAGVVTELIDGADIDTGDVIIPGAVSGGGGVTDHGALSGLGDDDHPHYHNNARGDARYDVLGAAATAASGASAALAAHVAALDPHPQYQTQTEGDTRYVRTVNGTGPDGTGNVTVAAGGGGGVTDHGALTGLTDDDHPQYHNNVRGDARYTVVVSSTSALKALDTTVVTSVALRVVAKEGLFTWRTGDYSSHIAADPEEGVYLKADAVAATSGAWVRANSWPINPRWFGTPIDGTDASAKFQAVIDFVKAHTAVVAGETDPLMGEFGTIEAGPYTYSIANPVDCNDARMVTVRGGRYSAISGGTLSSSNAMFSVEDTGVGGGTYGLSWFWFDSAQFDCNRITSAVKFKNAYRCGTRNCDVVHVVSGGNGIVIAENTNVCRILSTVIHEDTSTDVGGGDHTRGATGILVENSGDVWIDGTTVGWINTCVKIVNSSKVFITNDHLYCGSVGTPHTGTILDVDAASNNIVVQGNYLDSGFVKIRTNSILFDNNVFYWNGSSASGADAYIHFETAVASTYLFPRINGNNHFNGGIASLKTTTTGSGSFVANATKWFSGTYGISQAAVGAWNQAFEVLGAYPKRYIAGGDNAAVLEALSKNSWSQVNYGDTGTTQTPFTGSNGNNLILGTENNFRWSVYNAGSSNWSFLPWGDNAYSLGTAGNRPSVIYAASGTINTSDAREKTDVRALSAAEMRAAKRIKIHGYKWIDAVEKKGAAARVHFGPMAQEVEDAFAREGLNARDYGVFCEDLVFEINDDATSEDFGKQVPVLDEDGKQKTRLGVRMDQLLALKLAAHSEAPAQ